MPGLLLSARGLSLALDGTTIVQSIDFDATPGRLHVLAGPSGSGKSSLLYLLSGLLVPTSGSVSWAGTDIATLREGRRDAWRRQNAGFVFQDFHLIDELSPLDNVLTPAWLSRFAAGALRQRAEGLLDDLGVPRKQATALLSRGERQRVAVARALILDPPVIFADEPTASLDAEAARSVIGLLRALAHADGRTLIVATHDPELLAIADERLRLSHGEGRRVAA